MIIDGDDCVALYRMFDRDDDLLYVGISGNPWKRVREHQKTKFWFEHVRRVEFEWYSPPNFAAREERMAIALESPMFNQARPNWALPVPPHVEERYGWEA